MRVPDIPGMSAKIFGPLTEGEINVDMIVQNISADGTHTDMTFTVPRTDLQKALDALKNCPELRDTEIRSDEKVVKVSVIGIGMRSHAGVAQTMFQALADKGINIQVISTSEIKISVLVASEYRELAVRTLHSAYGLENIN
jgi:aspartate kinase